MVEMAEAYGWVNGLGLESKHLYTLLGDMEGGTLQIF